ncbi:MAG: hypothetical protein ACPG7W_04540 [Paracoccaceae bacterium]
MTRTWMALVAAALLVGGCSQVRESRLNPFNWFGRSAAPAATTEVPEGVNPLIPQGGGSLFAARPEPDYAGTPIDVISNVRLDPTPGGAILLVYGASAAMGAYDVRLVPDETLTGERVMVFDLRSLMPAEQQPGPQNIVAARTLSRQDLEGVREILVRGEQNSRSLRPR